MKKPSIILTILCILTLQSLWAAGPLQHAQPIAAGGEEGLAPMSFGRTYSNAPRGFASISSEQYPDLFVFIASGMPDARGFWRCPYDRITPEGELVYAAPQRVSTPWDKEKNFPSQVRIFQDGKEVYLLRLSTKRLVVTRWDGRFLSTTMRETFRHVVRSTPK